MRRREVLLGAVALAAGAGAVAWLVRGRHGGRGALDLARRPRAPSTFVPPGNALLLALADVIVPREGGSPAASEIDLIPRLEALARVEPARARFYREVWGPFELAVRRRGVAVGAEWPEPAALEALCQAWYRELRSGSFSLEARVFEHLRLDVLRAYYASPAGWAAVGYEGPPHAARPPESSCA